MHVSGQHLRVSIGAGSGTPLLLLNGLGANIEMWAPLREALRDRATIAVDAPGSGESSTPFFRPSIRYIANTIVECLDQLEIGSVDVLGYSFGGAIAQELAYHHPRRVGHLVLAATTFGWGAPMPSPAALATLSTPARYYLAPESDFLSASAFGDFEGTATFWRLGRARRRRPPSPYGYWWQVMAISGWTSRGWLNRLRVPCLVLTGEHDRVAGPVVARLLAESIPGATLKIASGAGHLLLYSDRPHPVVDDIADFLSSAPATHLQPSRAPASE